MKPDPFAPKVFDDALPPKLLEALIAAVAPLPNRMHSFWTGLQSARPPLIAAVISRLQALVDIPALNSDGAGVEWWVRKAPAYHFQPWHVDKDEALFMRDKVVRPPIAATILYLSDVGGPTIFSSQTSDTDGLRLLPPRLERAWTIAPRRNRFVVGRGNAIHAVLPARAQAHQVRTSMPINWWPSPTVANDRLSTDVGSYPDLAELMAAPVPAEPRAPSPIRIQLPTIRAADLPRPVEQRWPAWKTEPTG